MKSKNENKELVLQLQNVIDGLEKNGIYISGFDVAPSDDAAQPTLIADILLVLKFTDKDKGRSLRFNDLTLEPVQDMYHCDTHGGYGFSSDCVECGGDSQHAEFNRMA